MANLKNVELLNTIAKLNLDHTTICEKNEKQQSILTSELKQNAIILKDLEETLNQVQNSKNAVETDLNQKIHDLTNTVASLSLELANENHQSLVSISKLEERNKELQNSYSELENAHKSKLDILEARNTQQKAKLESEIDLLKADIFQSRKQGIYFKEQAEYHLSLQNALELKLNALAVDLVDIGGEFYPEN